ncbi:MAG: LicD family protein [Clostridia bacterium]|nr:LicD family protein [Clostridia bacterium]
MGIRNWVKGIAKRLVDQQETQEAFDALFYFLNRFCKVSDLPPAEGDLRLLQRGDTALLRVFDRLCEKHGLEYWISYGTALGAVRHGGFIPWDDDCDVCMDRENYTRAREILPKACAELGMKAGELSGHLGGWLGIGYEHEKTGLWIDVFPMEYSRTDPDSPAEREKLAREIHAYYQVFKKTLGKDPNMARQEEVRNRMITSLCGKEEAKSVIFASEYFQSSDLQRKDDILPVKRIAFENIELYGPASPEGYLREQYGDYMQFPRAGILHHGGSRGPLESWAKRSGTDMEEVIRTLEGMIQRI